MKPLRLTRPVPLAPDSVDVHGAAVPVRAGLPFSRLAVGLSLLATTMALATALGPAGIPLDAVGRLLLSALPGVDLTAGLPAQWHAILWEVRLPRVVVGALVGASLSIAGATYQGVFRNPLADPYLIGVSAGAGLGATLVLVFLPLPPGLPLATVVPLGAFLGALLGVGTAYGIARVDRRAPPVALILAGVAITSLAASVTTFIMLMDVQRTLTVLGWLLGSFNRATWGKLLWALPYIVPGVAVILMHGRILNVLQLDEEEAEHLGVRVERIKLVLLGAASLVTAAAVSVSGPIGFVGLLVPHMARLLWGPDHRHLLPLSMLLGASFMVVADLLARSLLTPGEVPVGIVTAFSGGPFFLYLLRRRQRGLAP